jgi:hypothetical protein
MSEININGNNQYPSLDGEWAEIGFDAGDEVGNNDLGTQEACEKTDSFGDRPHDISREKILDLYRKVDGMNRADEKDLLDVLKDALREEMASKRAKSSHDSERFAQCQEKIWGDYQEVFQEIQSDLGPQETEKDPATGGNTGETGDSRKPLNPNFADDSAPSRVDEKNKTAVYDVDTNVNIHSSYEDKIDTHEITASGTVTLHGGNQNASFVVTYDEGSKKFIISESGVDGNGKSVTETYKVDAENVTKVIFDSKKVDLSALTKDQQKKIQVGADAQAAKENAKVTWPTGQWKNFIPAGDHSSEAGDIAGKMDRCMQGQADWKTVLDDLNERNSWDGYYAHAGDQNLNDMIRKLTTALYRVSGASDQKDPRFVKLLQMIPPDVRAALIDWVTHCHDELGEKKGGEMWTSQETADILQTSLNQDNEISDPTGADSSGSAN